MSATYPFPSSKLKKLYFVTIENIAVVDGILQKKWPTEAKPLEALILDEVNYRITPDLVSQTDTAEAVAKMIVALQTPVPMRGMLKGSFPNKVGHEYVKKVNSFFEEHGGKSWLKSRFEPTSYIVPESRTYGTMPEKEAPNECRVDRNNAGDGDTHVLVGIIGLIVVYFALFSSMLLFQEE